MNSILGWKDILRPIRDGYRHLFPSPDTRPTPEERRKRREKDRLKGFAYFDTFEQLEAWTEADSDPLQRANTPLLLRSKVAPYENEKKARILLCHDYAGNYQDYEDVRSLGVHDEMYACEYLQYVDTFVYFSHKLVCVPPPTWINTLHRNGVMALGTLLVEPQTPDTDRLLLCTGEGAEMTFGLAKQLADIARHYGFDGYLVNIEKPFKMDQWDPKVLTSFLVQLKRDLGDGMQLTWYDALTTSNEVSYQNGLNVSNIPFAEACGNMLTNYCWTESQAKDSAFFAAQKGLSLENVFFGIDVWAQNSTKLTQPRTTFPKRGGGGTNTGVAVAKLAELGLSAGIFAPAWSFEHFPGRGREVERAVWEDQTLPEDITCPCGNATSRHRSHPESSVIQHAKVYPAGSESFFYTDFTRAFGLHTNEAREKIYDGHTLHTQLGAQSILPLAVPRRVQDMEPFLSHQLEDKLGHTKLVITSHYAATGRLPGQAPDTWHPLYRLNMPLDEPEDASLWLTITYRNVLYDTTSLYLKYHSDENPTKFYRHRFPLLRDETVDVMSTLSTPISLPTAANHKRRLAEVGVHIDRTAGEENMPILEIYSICIAPAQQVVETLSISDLRTSQRGDGENRHLRLCWSISDKTTEQSRLSGVPHSRITGSFSHFEIRVDGLDLGRAYALEHVLSAVMVEPFTGRDVEVNITGVGFDGEKLANCSSRLRLALA